MTVFSPEKFANQLDEHLREPLMFRIDESFVIINSIHRNVETGGPAALCLGCQSLAQGRSIVSQMLALKLVSTFICFVVLICEFCADRIWKHGNSTINKRLRLGVFVLGLLSGLVSMVVTYAESQEAKAASAKQEQSFQSLDQFTGGGLAPDIEVDLYIGPKQSPPAPLSLNPEFPNVVAVSVFNTNEFPIYDTTGTLLIFNAGGMASKTAATFNEHSAFGTLNPGFDKSIMLPADFAFEENDPRIAFDFFFQARRGYSRHEVRFWKTNGVWERASKKLTFDGKILSTTFSTNYPRASDGQPIWWPGTENLQRSAR